MREIVEGSKLRRLVWADLRTTVQISNNRLQISLPEKGYIPCDWIVADDVLAADWVLA